jgi:hypothetical protein
MSSREKKSQNFKKTFTKNSNFHISTCPSQLKKTQFAMTDPVPHKTLLKEKQASSTLNNTVSKVTSMRVF